MPSYSISRRTFGTASLAALGGAVLAGARSSAARADTVPDRILFHGGYESLNGVTYHSFRIPSIVRTKAGTLLALAEGRAASAADYGNINTVFKRSTNNGTSWSGLGQVVGVGQGTWGNPTAVVEQNSGTIYVFLSWNPEGYSQKGDDGTTPITAWDQRKVYLCKSTDDGQTWTDPVDMTETLKPRTYSNGKVWAFDACGPGVGIQTVVNHPGRLIVPATGRHFYSDDRGTTWKLALLRDTSGRAMDTITSEATVLERTDGSLYRNDRTFGATWDAHKRRQIAFGSLENGFTPFTYDDALLDEMCEASTLRYTASDPTRILFCNPASTVQRGERMRIRISYDEGRTWPISRGLDERGVPGGSGYTLGGYSSMAKTADFTTMVLVETKGPDGHMSIDAMKIPLSWILNGQSEP